MASKDKMFNNMSFEYVLGIVGILILLFALYKYSGDKNLQLSGMVNETTTSTNSTIETPSTQSSQPVQTTVTNPSELLPLNNSGWQGLNPNPTPSAGLQETTLINPGSSIGINTVGSSLRNANLQLRAEPANPRNTTNCPWNISTIEPDLQRKPLC